MRAVEVAAQLPAAGKIAPHDVAVIGFGEYEPIRPNTNAENKRLNRRVEIFVADRGTAQATPAAASTVEKKAEKH